MPSLMSNRDEWEDLPAFEFTDERLGERVDHPKHYSRGSIETIQAIMGLDLDPCEGNVLKYVSRHRDKNGIEDLHKAKKYLDLMIENYGAWYGSSGSNKR